MWHKGSNSISKSSKVCLLLVVTVYNSSQSVDVLLLLLYSTTRLTEVGNEEMKGKEEKKRQGKRENHWKEGDQCLPANWQWFMAAADCSHCVATRKTMDIDRTEHTQAQTQRVKRKERVILLLVDSSTFEREKWNLGDSESQQKQSQLFFWSALALNSIV